MSANEAAPNNILTSARPGQVESGSVDLLCCLREVVRSPQSQLVQLPSYHLHLTVSRPTNISKDQKTIIFIHGIGANAAQFNPLIEAAKLRVDYNIVTMDLEGHGLSPAPHGESQWDADHVADPVREVMDWLPTERATLLGHSAGVVSGILSEQSMTYSRQNLVEQFAMQYPFRVDKLVLISPVSPAYTHEIPNERYWQLHEAVIKEGPAALLPLWIRPGVTIPADKNRQQAHVIHMIKSALLQTTSQGAAQMFKACWQGALNWARLQSRGGQHIPVLCVFGDEDRVIRPDARQTHTDGPAKVTVINMTYVGHYPRLERADELAGHLLRFLDGDSEE